MSAVAARASFRQNEPRIIGEEDLNDFVLAEGKRRTVSVAACQLWTVSYSPYLETHIPMGRSTMAKITVLGYRCERCLHEWVPRRSSTTEPRTCPKCKSPYWDRPRTVVKARPLQTDSRARYRLAGDIID